MVVLKAIKNEENTWIAFILSPIMGFLAFLLPVLIVRDLSELIAIDNPQNLIGQSFELMRLKPTAIILMLIGFSLGYIWPKK